MFVLKEWDLETSGESNQVESNAHAGTSSGASSHGGDEDIQHAKGGGGGQADDDDFFDLEGVFGDGVGGDGHHKTFDNVLDGSLDEFTEIKDVAHFDGYILYENKKSSMKDDACR